MVLLVGLVSSMSRVKSEGESVEMRLCSWRLMDCYLQRQSKGPVWPFLAIMFVNLNISTVYQRKKKHYFQVTFTEFSFCSTLVSIVCIKFIQFLALKYSYNSQRASISCSTFLRRYRRLYICWKECSQSSLHAVTV